MTEVERYERIFQRNQEIYREMCEIDRAETAAGRNFLEDPRYRELAPALAKTKRQLDAIEKSLTIFTGRN